MALTGIGGIRVGAFFREYLLFRHGLRLFRSVESSSKIPDLCRMGRIVVGLVVEQGFERASDAVCTSKSRVERSLV